MRRISAWFVGADPWWVRAHRALMPDYNRKATVYWWVMVALGVAILAHSLRTLAALPLPKLAGAGIGAAVAMIAALFPVRVPRSKNSFAAGEIFIFLLLLLFGTAAATLAAVGEGLIGACRTSKRWTSRIATPAMASVAIFIAGSLIEAILASAQTRGWHGAALLLVATMLGSVVYFVLNTTLIAAVPYLKRNQRPVLRELFGDFGWLGITYAGSASVASLLFLTFQVSGLGVLLAAVPIIAMLLCTLHYFFRQQEADDLVRKGRVDAAEREAELAARHMQALQVSERRFHSAFTHASIGMALIGVDGQVLQANAALRTLLGVPNEGAIVERRFGDFVDPDDAALLSDHLARLNAQQVVMFEVELRLRHADGSALWVALHGSVFSEAGASAPCLILQVQNVTERRTAQEDLHYIAFHDSLTGLPNRRRFQEVIARLLGNATNDPRRHFALLFLDFDRFKLINDSLGHAAGDEFLIEAARRIQLQLRPHDIVARLGGDEFAILAEDVEAPRHAVGLADRLIEALSQPLRIAGNEITTGVSIGITFSNMGYVDSEDMVRDADTAMYQAKAAGKGRYALFDGALHTQVSHRMRLEGDLRRALADGQLSVAYQPLYGLDSGRLGGFEALARWVHPELGPIAPSTFIPIAEDTGLSIALTDFVLRTACCQLREWQLRDQRYGELTMHVNLSGSDVSHPQFVARVNRALVMANLQPQHLALELTENILMERLEASLPQLTEIRRLGVGLSVDDFGTGYSSLQHLAVLPVSCLKIDRAFVQAMHQGTNEAAIVRSIVMLGTTLGKTIIAEGIETEQQLTGLQQMGCLFGQGHYLSRPLAADLVGKLLDATTASAHLATGSDRFVAPPVLH